MTAFSQSLLQQADQNGSPLIGWSVKFFQSGTNTAVAVWKDVACTSPHATSVKADGQGRLPTIYFTRNGIKLRAEITFPDGRVRAIDDIDPGPADATTEETDPRLPSVAHTGLTVTLTAADAGKVHAIPTALGSATAVLLPRASTLKDGQVIGLANAGAGTVIYRTQGTDLINNRVSLLLTEPEEMAVIRCNGAGFERLASTQKSQAKYVVLDNTVSSAPVAPAAGVTYLAPASTTGTVWAPNIIYQADGVGGWISHVPVVGDEAIVTSKTTTIGGGVTIPLRLLWTGTAWVDQSNFDTQNRFIVQSATTALPPTGSPAGTMYLAPAGASGGWTGGNIYTSDGNNGWASHTPVIGDEVITRDATTIVGSTTVPKRYFYYNGSWLDELVFNSKAAALHVRGEFASGTGSNSAYGLGGAAPTVSVYTQVLLNTTLLNSIGGATVTGNVITLPAGTYRVRAKHKMKGAISARLKFVSTSTITAVSGMSQLILASTAGVVDLEGQVTVAAASESFQLMFILSGTAAASTLGDAASISGESEVYGELFIAAV